MKTKPQDELALFPDPLVQLPQPDSSLSTTRNTLLSSTFSHTQHRVKKKLRLSGVNPTFFTSGAANPSTVGANISHTRNFSVGGFARTQRDRRRIIIDPQHIPGARDSLRETLTFEIP